MSTHIESPTLDLAGLGIGPFNLSIAALLTEVPECKAAFFDQKAGFNWHPGMLLPGVRLQTSYLKDLVTGVSPTNNFSFLNYLVKKRRFYQFLSAELTAISRKEYADYLTWVSDQLHSLNFGHGIEAVSFEEDQFILELSNGEKHAAKNICLGTGKQPYVPDCAKEHLGQNCFHAIGIALKDLDLNNKKVAIIGGGQTGAEILETILDRRWGEPTDVSWVSRRQNFEPLDESPFTNEYFTPQYVDTFYHQPDRIKDRVMHSQKLASDGISPDTLKSLYRKLYEYNIDSGVGFNLHMRPNRELFAMEKQGGTYKINALNGLTQQVETTFADVVILCTGFEFSMPSYLEPIKHKLNLDEKGRYKLGRDFHVEWDGPESNRIYAVNAGRHSHGIAEPQMSLMCWRSATIINDMLGLDVFDLNQSMNMVEWSTESPAELELAV